MGGCRGRGQERLSIAGEVLRAVGGVEAFWEDDDFGALGGGGEDLGARVGEVGGFVGAWGGFVSIVDEEGGGGCIPLASCTRASLTGCFRTVDMVDRLFWYARL